MARGSGRLRRQARRRAPRRGEPVSDDVVAEHVVQRVGLGHRLDVVEIEGIDVFEVLEHAGELRRHPLDDGRGEVESGQFGHVHDIVGGDPF